MTVTIRQNLIKRTLYKTGNGKDFLSVTVRPNLIERTLYKTGNRKYFLSVIICQNLTKRTDWQWKRLSEYDYTSKSDKKHIV